MRRSIGLSALIAFGVTSLTIGQDNLQQLKQQISALQQQLEALENTPQAPKRNVTQIGASRARKVETGLVVRIYDLGDLFAVAPPYAAQLNSDLNPGVRSFLFDTTPFSNTGSAPAHPPGMGGGGMGGMGGGGGFFSVTPAAALVAGATGQVSGGSGTIKSAQDELIAVIKEIITPELWKDGGGKISKLGNAFVISADEDSHLQIEALLNSFRSRWGTLRTVSVRGWWMSLSPAELRTLLDAPNEAVMPDGPKVFGIVSDEAWQELMQIWQQPAGNDAHRLRYQATLTCYNGQTVNTLSGTQGLVVSGIEPVVAQGESGEAQGRVGYRPETALIQEGLAFQVTPITNVSGKTVLLDVHSRLTLPTDDGDQQAAGKRQFESATPDDVVRPINRRKLNIHRLSTTARVPTDRPYLIGGMSLPAADTEGLQLYLFVKISVQELRNDQEPVAAPPKDPKPDEKVDDGKKE